MCPPRPAATRCRDAPAATVHSFSPQVEIADRIRARHGVARLELAYTGIDDGAVFRCGGVELRLRAVDDEDLDDNYLVPRTYALLNDQHVPLLDGCWSVKRRIAVEIEVDTVRGHVAFAVRARRGEAGSRRRRGG